jgi:arsenic resistance protein ArsH
MLTIPNQSSVAKAFLEFDDNGRMKPSAYYDRVVDVMEELVKFTLRWNTQPVLLVLRGSPCAGSKSSSTQRALVPPRGYKSVFKVPPDPGDSSLYG